MSTQGLLFVLNAMIESDQVVKVYEQMPALANRVIS